VETLPDMPPGQFAPVGLDAKNALARALRPEYIGIRPEDYADITPDMVEMASADSFRRSLIDVGRSSPATLPYMAPRARRPLFVAVTSAEFTLLSGNLTMLGERAVKRTETARQQAAGLSQSDYAATQRSGAHAVESRVAVMERYLAQELLPENDLIAKFREAARYPGRSRLSDEAAMRMGLTTVREQVFGKIFEALRAQRHWSPEQEDRARRAVERRLFIDRFNNQHINRFDAMLALAEERNGYLHAITRHRIHQAKKYIGQRYLDAG